MAVIVTAGYLLHRESKRGERCDGNPCPWNGFGNVDFRESSLHFRHSVFPKKRSRETERCIKR